MEALASKGRAILRRLVNADTGTLNASMNSLPTLEESILGPRYFKYTPQSTWWLEPSSQHEAQGRSLPPGTTLARDSH